MGILNHVTVFGEGSEHGYEALWFFDREGEGLEEPRLAAAVGMSGVQQIVNDLTCWADAIKATEFLRRRS